MGEKQEQFEQRPGNGGCCKGLVLTLSLMCVVSAFGVVNYLQFEEILSLKIRVADLELNLYRTINVSIGQLM